LVRWTWYKVVHWCNHWLLPISPWACLDLSHIMVWPYSTHHILPSSSSVCLPLFLCFGSWSNSLIEFIMPATSAKKSTVKKSTVKKSMAKALPQKELAVAQALSSTPTLARRTCTGAWPVVPAPDEGMPTCYCHSLMTDSSLPTSFSPVCHHCCHHHLCVTATIIVPCTSPPSLSPVRQQALLRPQLLLLRSLP